MLKKTGIQTMFTGEGRCFLKCSYAHGTKAIRTHIDSGGEQSTISLAVFEELRAEWSDRLILQAVSLVSLDHLLTPAGEKLADKMKAAGIPVAIASDNCRDPFCGF